MSPHNIGFYEEISKNYHLIIIKYHQIRTLFLLLVLVNLLRLSLSKSGLDLAVPFEPRCEKTGLLCF